MNDVKTKTNDNFLSNLSKEKERQNNAIGVSGSSLGNGGTFKADNQYKSPLSDVKIKEPKNSQPWIYHDLKPKDYVQNRYSYEKQNPSNEIKALQTSLNNFGYTGKDNKPLKVDGAYGPNTDLAFNNAWKNNEKVIKNRELVQKREIIEPMLNKIYEPMKEKANSRKHNASKDEIMQIQNMLIDEGHTDWDGNPIKVTGEFNEKTLGAYEKYIQESTPKQDVYDMQKEMNALGITDADGNQLKQDGLLGIITDKTVHRLMSQTNNLTSQDVEPVRGDVNNLGVSSKNFAYYNAIANGNYTTIENTDTKNTSNKYNLDNKFMEEMDYNKFASLNSDPYFQKIYEDSVKNNVEIKNKPNLQKYDIPYQYKVTDEEVLDEFDMMKIEALKGLYNWAMNKGDRLTADKAHKVAVDIRSNPKYNGTGYGENYIDNYIYSDEFDKDAEFYSLIETPLDKYRTANLHSDLIDDIIGAGIPNKSLEYAGNTRKIKPSFATAGDMFLQLMDNFGGVDDYVPQVEIGDIPIHIDGIRYFYRPSDGTVIIG